MCFQRNPDRNDAEIIRDLDTVETDKQSAAADLFDLEQSDPSASSFWEDDVFNVENLPGAEDTSAFENGESGDILVQKAPACTIQTQAEAVCELFGGDKNDIKVIGIRHGEKMYETLLTNEECAHAIDMGDFYRVPCDKRQLNYDKYFKQGDTQRNTLAEFNSNNTELLTVEQTKEKIAALAYIQEELAKGV